MSGIAIVLENADFSEKNVGVVTFFEPDVPVVALEITGDAELNDTEVRLGVTYIPASTGERGVVWSVLSGAATITQDGVLTPDEYEDTTVVVKAVSRHNENVFATKEISFLYDETIRQWTSGYYSNTGFSNQGGGRYYTIVDGIPVEDVATISCSEGYYFRLVFFRNSSATSGNMVSRDDVRTSAIISEIAPSSATTVCINFSHDDVTNPSSGTIMTEEEVANINRLITITPPVEQQ